MKRWLMAALALTLGLSSTARGQQQSEPRAQTDQPTPPPATPAVPTPPIPQKSHAGAAGDFGNPGQFVVGVDVPFQNDAAQVALVPSNVSMGGGSSTIVAIRPSLDYFVAPNVTVGGMVGYVRGDSTFGGGASSDTEVIVGVRGGYNLRMTDLVSLWGRVEVVYAHISGGVTGYLVPLIVNVPVLIHPASHFFLGAGPTFSTELASSSVARTTNYGLQGIIGGYFGD